MPPSNLAIPRYSLRWLTAAFFLRNQASSLVLVDPVELGRLPADELALLEPESNLLLGVLDAVGAVADVAADVDGEVATDGAGGGGEGVGGAEDGCCRGWLDIVPWAGMETRGLTYCGRS